MASDAERLAVIEGLLGPLGSFGPEGCVIYAAFRVAIGADLATTRRTLTRELDQQEAPAIGRYWPEEELNG